jgi:hypothetical protein
LRRQPEYAEAHIAQGRPSSQRGYTFTPARTPAVTSNLDVPAFLRKRMRG